MVMRPTPPMGGQYLPGEVGGYARKSVDDRNGNFSIEGQSEEMLATAEEYNLPLTREDILVEVPGHGGDEWWKGGGFTGLEGDQDAGGKTRPKLTELLKQVVAGKIRCVIVYSQCRLWRDVAICEHLIKLLARYGCALYDRYGPVDISTPEGRNKVRSNAVAAQNQREMAADSAPRGIMKKLKRGKVVTNGHRLGFRSVGNYTGEITHIPEEQELVRKIYRDYADLGKSVDTIARELTEMGMGYISDIYERNRRKHKGTKLVYRQVVRKILTDVRYQGQQPWKGEPHDCPAFLVDGEPVVPTALFERAQERMASSRRGAPSHSKSHPLSGIMRCGHCGQSMRSHRGQQKLKSGKVLIWHTWKSLRYAEGCWCTDDLPVLYVDDIDSYVNEILAPLLIAELQERSQADRLSALRDERAGCQRKLNELERKRREELPKQYADGDISLETLEDAKGVIRQLEAPIKTRAAELDLMIHADSSLVARMDDLQSADRETRRLAIRAVLRWAAVIPSNLPRTKDSRSYKWVTPEDAGRVVFLTAWGSLHTAFIERGKREGHRTRLCYLRPAAPEECIGSVCEFPEPGRFVAGLERGFKGSSYFWPPEKVVPGWSASSASRTAEFDVDDGDISDDELGLSSDS